MNKIILIIEYNDRPAQVLASDSYLKLSKLQARFEDEKDRRGIKSMRIEPLADLEDFQE